jgi:hypothetical protein
MSENTSHPESNPELAFGEETLILNRRFGHDTRLLTMQLLDAQLPLVEVGQAVGRDAADILNFALRVVPKLKAIEPDPPKAEGEAPQPLAVVGSTQSTATSDRGST